MAKHVDITKWDRHKIGTEYMNAMVKLELAERRLASMTLSDGTVPETRFMNHAETVRQAREEIKTMGTDFISFKAIVFAHMDWMSTDIKWKEDQLHDGEGVPVEYSKELTAALEFVKELKGE
jgi:hypothetical protein